MMRCIDASCLPVQKLQEVMRPLAKAATLLPPAAFRADPLVALTAFARYIPYLVQVISDVTSLLAGHL